MSFERGNKLYNNGRYEQAINEYIESIDSYEKVEDCYYNMGVTYIKLKEYDEAIKYLKKAISFSRQSKYFYNLGCCYYWKNDYGSAMFNLIIAYRLDEEDGDVREAINIVAKVINNEEESYES